MEEILSKRYAFYIFLKIDGFSNPMPNKSEWEVSLPQFSGHDWEMPAEVLWDFHEWIHRLHVVHKDVKIKLFRFSLKGATLDWCRNIHKAGITCLREFHDDFNLVYKDRYPIEFFFPECCHHFDQHVVSYEEKHNEILDRSEEGVQQPDCSHDFTPSPIIEERSEQHEEVITKPCHDSMNQQFFYDFLDEEVSLSPSCQIYSGGPIYDSYESEFDENCEEEHTQPTLTTEGILSFPNVDIQEGIPHDFQEVLFDFYPDEISDNLHDIEMKDEVQAYVQTEVILLQQVPFQNEKDLIDLLVVDSMSWQSFGIDLDFYDPIVDWMDSFSTSVSCFTAIHMMDMDCSCKYMLLFHPFLNMLQHYYLLLYCCRKNWFMISWLRGWLHWKLSYT